MVSWEWVSSIEWEELQGVVILDVDCDECKVKNYCRFNFSVFEEFGFWV